MKPPFILLLLLTIGLSLCTGYQCLAQYKNPKVKNRLLQFGLQSSLIKSQDRANSPLLYQGGGLGLQAGFQKYRLKSLQLIEADYTFGLLYPRTGDELADASVFSHQAGLSYRYLRHIPLNRTDLEVWAGGIAQFKGHLRNHTLFVNSAYSFEAYVHAGASGRVAYTPSFSKRLQGYWQLDLPLGGYAIRTFYATPLNINDIEGKGSGIGSYPMVNSELGINYRLFNGNYIGICYQWDYYSFNYLNTVRNAMHAFSFFFLFQL